MVTGEAMPWEECLSCAMRRVNTCGWDYSLLAAVSRYQQKVRTGYHVTDLTGCLRKAWYNHTTEADPAFPSDYMYVFLGTAIHQFLEHSNHDMWSELPVQALFNGIPLVGTVDVYYPSGRIVDYKTSIISRDNLPYTDHALQVNVYGVMLAEMGLPVYSAAIQYVDKVGPSTCPVCKQKSVEPGPLYSCKICGSEWDRDNPGLTKAGKPRAKSHPGAWLVEIDLDPDSTKQFVEDRLTELDRCVQTGETPAGEPSFLCNYCKFRSVCDARA